MPIAIIVPILEIESILSNGVGPFMALTKHINTEIPKIDNVKKNIIYLSQLLLYPYLLIVNLQIIFYLKHEQEESFFLLLL